MLYLEAGKIIVDNATMYMEVDTDNDTPEVRPSDQGQSSIAIRSLYFEKDNKRVNLIRVPGNGSNHFSPDISLHLCVMPLIFSGETVMPPMKLLIFSLPICILIIVRGFLPRRVIVSFQHFRAPGFILAVYSTTLSKTPPNRREIRFYRVSQD